MVSRNNTPIKRKKNKTNKTNNNNSISSATSAESPGEAYFDLQEKQDNNNVSKSHESEGSSVPLTWRGDPSETFSDWTIVIVTNELETLTFHVHKSVLCFGSRQSRYFARAMVNHHHQQQQQQQQQKQYTPEKNNLKTSSPTVKVELDQRDANNFTILLDYMYAPCSYLNLGQGTMDTATLTSTLTSPSALLLSASSSTDDDVASYMALGEDINSENAVSLRHLARLFQVDSFMLAVNKFIQRDLSFATGPTYLIRASEYRDERLVESARRLCVENFEQLDQRALINLPLHLFRIIVKSLESFDDENQSLSQFLSEVVCRYLEKHRKELSAELLLELTDPLVMPHIASEAAIGFTALIKGLDPEQTKAFWDPMADLCRRCARSVVQVYGWNEFCVHAAVDEYLNNCRHCPSNSTGASTAPLSSSSPARNKSGGNTNTNSNVVVSHVDSLLFATSFAAALEQAQNDFDEIVKEQEQVESVVGALNQTISSMEKAHELKDNYLIKQQNKLEQANKEIRDLKQQVAELLQHQQLQQHQILRQQQQQLQQEQLQQQQRQQHEQQQQHQQYQAQLQQQYQEKNRPRSPTPSIVDEPILQMSSTLSSTSGLTGPSSRQTMSTSTTTPPRPTPPRPARAPHTTGGSGTSTAMPCLSPRLYEDPAIRDLISPSSVGTDVHRNKKERIKELRTKAEMRTRSLLV